MMEGRKIPKQPVAKMAPQTTSIHDDVRVDYYHWLRQKDNPDTVKYIREENRYTEEIMEDTKDLQHRLYHEMVARMTENDLSAHEKIDNYYYYKRKMKGKQYPIYCRKRAKFQAKEEVLLDLNLLEPFTPYIRLGIYQISPDQQKLAYSIDLCGGESFQLFIKDLKSNITFADTIQNTSCWAVWGSDNKTIYYSTLDSANRPYRLYCHTLGTDPSGDVLIYQENDPAFSIQLEKTKNKRFVILYLRSNTTTEVRIGDTKNEDKSFWLLYPRENGIHYHLENNGNLFYVLTNRGASNYRVISADIHSPGFENWKDIIPGRENVTVESIEMFARYLAVFERVDGFKKIIVYDLKTLKSSSVHFIDKVYDCRLGRNFTFNTDILRYHYSSFKTPPSIFDYHMRTKKRKLRKQKKVKNYNPALYQVESLTAKASDNEEIPLSLVYRKGILKDGANPMLLYAYGAYGAADEPAFDSRVFSLIDRGFIYGIAHVRGGGKKGRPWHQQGKLFYKKNTFTDFIACAELLIQGKYTSPEKLFIMGESAGGMLMGVLANLRPELFRGVIAKVPFVDVLNTMLDPSLPLTVPEFEEWGNPQNETAYEYIKSYSPYDNIEVKPYPNMLLTAGMNDSRVGYWEAAKFTAKLRAFKTSQDILLLKTDLQSGHEGQSGRYNRLKETAFIYAFILHILQHP